LSYPPTLLPRVRPYPRGSQDTAEMDRALEDTRDYYGGPTIRMPGYPGVHSPPFYSVPPDSSPEAPSAPRDESRVLAVDHEMS
jgi:hypothetical protein